MGLIASQLRVYLVTDPVLCATHGVPNTVRDAVRGGVTMVQLRDKEATTEQRIHVGRALMNALHGTGIPLLINDDVEAARVIGAHGVHVGQSDRAPDIARAQLGPHAIIGLSCETVDHVRAVDTAIVDYVGLGPVFDTSTKPDHATAMGIEGLAAARAATSLPAVAIGGIHHAHLSSVLATGVNGVAVVSAICGRPDPFEATQRLRRVVDAHLDTPPPHVS